MISLIQRILALLDTRLFEGFVLLLVRLALAAQFWRSARTKIVDGSWLQIDPITFDLFRDEYHMPLPEVTGVLATYAEHGLSALVMLGLATRFGAAGLLLMTAVIQLFVYPDAFWTPHVMWFGLALVLIARGGGLFALDRLADQALASKGARS
ncbi:DoxX family protein [Blastomonas sp.]|uniref:DoxX family protein n=1 Tax=Blastomonas sp. TaxID=1909299 RepID=UPI00261370B5|nr:DoxX family protein [Blastomonas sp.]MDM7957250.1 DoxX family protein [Blastomonas sp.]